MATDVSKIKLGPCKVTYDAGGLDEVVFETTQGGVQLTYEETTREVNVDQFGSTPAKEIVTGRTAQIIVPFAEKDNEKLAKIIPGANLVTDSASGTTRVDVNATKVIDLYDYAKKVVLEPLNDDATPDDKVVLYMAAPRPQLNYTYSYDNELITNVTFKAYPDPDGNLIGFGDPDATEE